MKSGLYYDAESNEIVNLTIEEVTEAKYATWFLKVEAKDFTYSSVVKPPEADLEQKGFIYIGVI